MTNEELTAIKEARAEITKASQHRDLDRVSEPIQRAGEALGRIARGLGDFIRAMVDYVASICPPGLIEAAKAQQALKEAPPRIRHLAYNSKKLRVQKKNINRAAREYQRRQKP